MIMNYSLSKVREVLSHVTQQVSSRDSDLRQITSQVFDHQTKQVTYLSIRGTLLQAAYGPNHFNEVYDTALLEDTFEDLHRLFGEPPSTPEASPSILYSYIKEKFDSLEVYKPRLRVTMRASDMNEASLFRSRFPPPAKGAPKDCTLVYEDSDLTVYDLRRLFGADWFNDSLFNFLLDLRLKKKNEEDINKKTVVFNTYFMDLLIRDLPENDVDGIHRWLTSLQKENGKLFESSDTFLFPVNYNKVHWLLFELTRDDKAAAFTITCFDSLYWKDQKPEDAQCRTKDKTFFLMIQQVVPLLQSYWDEDCEVATQPVFSYVYRQLDIPGQHDAVHCGLYVLTYIDLLISRGFVDLRAFSYQDIPVLKNFSVLSCKRREYVSPFDCS